MEDSLKNLSVLFRDTLFRIPDYQRGYAWEKKQYEDFWNDLSNIDLDKGGKDHYAGVLTTQLIPQNELSKGKWHNDYWLIQNKNYIPVYIVDGQQRLTTAILLISSLIETVKNRFPEETELNYTSIDQICDRFLFEKKGKTETYSCIFGYETTDPSFYYFCEKILRIPVFGHRLHKTKYTENLNEAHEFYKTKFHELSFTEIEKMYSKITNNLVFNMYQISDKLDVFVTFETMNNRGKMLSTLELLKNRFIYLTTLAPDNPEIPHSNQSAREIINDSWKIVYSYLGKNDKQMLDDETFLTAHTNIYMSENSFINENIKKERRRRNFGKDQLLDNVFTRNNLNIGKVTIDDVVHFSQRLSNNSKLWYEINNPERANFSADLCEEIFKYRLAQSEVRSFNYGGIRVGMINIFEFFQKEQDEQIRILYIKYLLQNLIYMNIFEGLDPVAREIYSINSELMEGNISKESLKKSMASVRRIFRGADLQDILIDELYKQIKQGSPSTKDRRLSFYNNYRFPTKFVLKLYELSLINSNKDMKKNFSAKKDILFGDYNVEHVYPQNDNADWKSTLTKEFTVAQRYNLKNTLGNLVYITTEKNEKLGAKLFVRKLGKLGSEVGFINGNYSEKEIAQNEVWTDKQILDRGVKLITFYLDLLQLPHVSKQNKKKLLGLEFLE